MKIGTFCEYKGYVGTIECDIFEFFGKIENISEGIVYCGTNIFELNDNFHKAVDDYIYIKENFQN